MIEERYTVAELLKYAKESLNFSSNVDSDDVETDALELVSYAAEIRRKNINSCLSQYVGEEQLEKLKDALRRRASGEPLQYILGEWDFYNLTFKVGDGVLIPRPETELLVDTSLSFLRENFDDVPSEKMYEMYKIIYGRDASRSECYTPCVLDLCAGSGCIGTTIAYNFDNCKVLEVEKSHRAFEYLKQNIALYGLKNVTPFLDDVITGCGHIVNSSKIEFDLIVSNPPYIRSDEIEVLQSEVQREPHMALDGGEDGLDFYRAIAQRWIPKLKPGGLLIVECGEDEADEIMSIFAEKVSTSCGNVFKKQDFSGIYRIVGLKMC